MVYVELPAVGATLTAGKTFGVVESVKARPGATPPAPLAPRPLQTHMPLAIASPCRLYRCTPRLGGDRGAEGLHQRRAGLKACGATAADVAALRRSQAASDVYSPVSGTVVETNGALADAPATARAPKPPKQRARHPNSGLRLCYSTSGRSRAARFPQVNSSPFDDAWMMKVKLSNPAGAQPEMLLHALGSRCGLSFRR